MLKRLEFHYKVTKKKLKKGVEFFRLWLEWCREFDKQAMNEIRQQAKGRKS